jgi:type I restriction enzyme M protein
VLFVDAHALGGMVSRTQRILTQEDVRQITATYGAWRDRWSHGGYEDIRGFSASVTTQEIRAHDYRLTPSTYVGAPIATPKPAETALGLRRRLDRLRAHAIDVDAMAERQLNRIDAWTP